MQKVRLREVKQVARGHTESQSHVLDLNSKGLVFVIQVLKHIRGVNPGSNQVSLTAWSHQVTHSPKVNSSARCSSSSKPPTIPLPSSAFYIHSPFPFFQWTTYLPHHGSGHSWNPILFFKAHLKYDPFFESFLNFAHSPQQMIGSLLVLFLALSTWHCS